MSGCSATAGLLQNSADKSVPVSNDIADVGQAAGLLGRSQELQGLHIGFFVAHRCARRVLLRPQPHDAGIRGARRRLQPGGGGLRRHQRSEESHPGNGDLRCVRRSRRSSRHDAVTSTTTARPTFPLSNVGFLGIAVALLGRNTAVGVGLASLLFGGLLYGTTHGLSSNVIQPELAGNLTYIIQGLIVLFVGADLLILSVWNARRKLRPKPTERRRCRRDAVVGGASKPVSTRLRNPANDGLRGARDRRVRSVPRDPADHRRARSPGRSPSASSRASSVSGRVRAAGAGSASARWSRARGDRPRHSRHPLERREPERGLRRVAGGADVRVRDAARVRRDRRDVLGAQRRREHRPRGNDADGRVLGRLRRRQGRIAGSSGSLSASVSEGCSRSCTRTSRST